MGYIGRAVTRATVWAAGVFYRVERVGTRLPRGPVVIVSNHPNMLMDPLLSLAAAGRRVRILAKAPLFDIPIFGSVLRSLDTLPLYRLQDDPEQRHRNRLAFQEAVDTLRAGGTLLTFPEGRSHSEPRLAPLKTGAARMALAAEEQSGWGLGVKVVATGLTYQRKHRFRSRVVVATGEPIDVDAWRQPYERDRVGAIGSLTLAIARSLEGQTLSLADEADRALAETADLVLGTHAGAEVRRGRQPLGKRLPQMQRLARAFAWLRAVEPQRWEPLARGLRRYRRRLEYVGSGAADAPRSRSTGGAVAYVLGEAAKLGLGLPAAALGTALWYVAYLVTDSVCRLLRPPVETVATVKLLAGVVSYPLTYAAWVAVAGWAGGVLAALAAALALPPLGLAALHWQERRREVWEDVKLLLGLVRHPRLRDRLAGQRASLAAALAALLRDWEEAERVGATRPPA